MPHISANYYSSAAAEASGVVKASAGVLMSFTVFNDNASARFIQFFDSATVPADSTVPVLVVKVGADDTYEWNGGPMGMKFGTGISYAISTTGATKTIAGADATISALYTE